MPLRQEQIGGHAEMFRQRADVRQRQLPFAPQNHRAQRPVNDQQPRRGFFSASSGRFFGNVAGRDKAGAVQVNLRRERGQSLKRRDAKFTNAVKGVGSVLDS